MNYNGYQCAQIILSSTFLLVAAKLGAADDCVDKIANCRSYGQAVCSNYKDWATLNCAYTCAFCVGPTPKKECTDHRSDCDQFVSNLCTSSSWRVWAGDNCSKFCGFCSTAVTTDATTRTTQTPTATSASPATVLSTSTANVPCSDGLNFCLVYSKMSCMDLTWADKYCRKSCSRC